MITFENLEFKHNKSLEGITSKFMFANNRGCSVVRHRYSYGNKKGLFEIAVLDCNGYLDYSTEITSDVVGFLTKERVSEVMIKIQNLPKL